MVVASKKSGSTTVLATALFPFLPLLAAFWPVWWWYGARVTDGSDEPWGLIALLVLVAFLSRAEINAGQRLSQARCFFLVLLLFLYSLSWWFMPRLLQAVIACACIGLAAGALTRPGVFSTGPWGLLFLSLPVISSLQFYLGYPLRLLVAAASACLLRISGFAVAVQGTALQWGSHLVEVDAPCSGVRMLWSALVLACTILCFRRTRTIPSLLFIGLAAALAVGANVLRTASLFISETILSGHRLPVTMDWVHSGQGLAIFALVVIFMLVVAGKLPSCAPASADCDTELVPNNKLTLAPACLRSTVAVLAVVAALTPLLPFHPAAARTSVIFPGWPHEFQGRPLKQLPLTGKERRYLDGFPGRVGRFSDGVREIVIRWVAKPTRQLHGASDCLRAQGYSIMPQPLFVDDRGFAWQQSSASSAREKLRILERIEDSGSQSFTDVSSWYWSAMLNRSRGPWWAITVAERAP